jgi:hypothetical protein
MNLQSAAEYLSQFQAHGCVEAIIVQAGISKVISSTSF